MQTLFLLRFDEPNRSEDNCHWKDSFYCSQVSEEGQPTWGHLGWSGDRGSQGESGQEPLLWFPWEGTAKAGKQVSDGLV